MSELPNDTATESRGPAPHERNIADRPGRRWLQAAGVAEPRQDSVDEDDTDNVEQPRRGRRAMDRKPMDGDDRMTTGRDQETEALEVEGNQDHAGPTEQSGNDAHRRFARPADDQQPDGPVRVPARDQALVARTENSTARVTSLDPADRRRSAGDLIEQLTPPAPAKATRGWRSLLGLRPSQREADELRDLATVKTVYRRPVTVMVANPKGGSGKTPTSLLLAAAFGLHRGGGVVAWDNNELRGTMPDRTSSPHRRNVHDMLGALDQLRWSTSQFTDLAYFLNHQDTGNFHTLGSAQNAGHLVTGQNFRQVHELFARYFQVIVVDTGNNEAAPNWAAAAGEADCLVVPTKWRKDSLIPAARMLESLQDTNPALLERTVIAATNGPEDSQQNVKDNGASWFGSSHPIVDIPTDPHIAEGGVIDFGRLRPATRRAALRLAAEVSTRLLEHGHAQD